MSGVGKSIATRRLIWPLIGCSILVLLAANARVVYVATQSQSDCVMHHRPGEATAASGSYGAAQSSCTPHAARAGVHPKAE